MMGRRIDPPAGRSTPTAVRTIIINADDVGMHPSIDGAVALLAQDGIVTSASVMAFGRPDSNVLATLQRHGVSIGLHLDFTSAMAAEQGYATGSLMQTIAAAWTGRIDPVRTRESVRVQIERFADLAGRLPDFVDGHEHVHQFPAIREALIAILAENIHARPFYVRNTRPTRWRGCKAALIGALGARELGCLAGRSGYYCNKDFFGVYAPALHSPLESLWRKWLSCLPACGALAMCHVAEPGWASEAFRAEEFGFLGSARFHDLLLEVHAMPCNWQGAVRHAGNRS